MTVFLFSLGIVCAYVHLSEVNKNPEKKSLWKDRGEIKMIRYAKS